MEALFACESSWALSLRKRDLCVCVNLGEPLYLREQCRPGNAVELEAATILQSICCKRLLSPQTARSSYPLRTRSSEAHGAVSCSLGRTTKGSGQPVLRCLISKYVRSASSIDAEVTRRTQNSVMSTDKDQQEIMAMCLNGSKVWNLECLKPQNSVAGDKADLGRAGFRGGIRGAEQRRKSRHKRRQITTSTASHAASLRKKDTPPRPRTGSALGSMQRCFLHAAKTSSCRSVGTPYREHRRHADKGHRRANTMASGCRDLLT